MVDGPERSPGVGDEAVSRSLADLEPSPDQHHGRVGATGPVLLQEQDHTHGELVRGVLVRLAVVAWGPSHDGGRPDRSA